VRVDRVFALLIESGFIYCCIWVCPTSISSAEGFTELLQILYVISAFQVLPDPGFTVMDAVLLFISVSSATWSFYISSGTEYQANIGSISDAHSHPRCHAEEPSRTLLDPLDRRAVASIRTIPRIAVCHDPCSRFIASMRAILIRKFRLQYL
jgi:hypothetical protein